MPEYKSWLSSGNIMSPISL